VHLSGACIRHFLPLLCFDKLVKFAPVFAELLLVRVDHLLKEFDDLRKKFVPHISKEGQLVDLFIDADLFFDPVLGLGNNFVREI